MSGEIQTIYAINFIKLRLSLKRLVEQVCFVRVTAVLALKIAVHSASSAAGRDNTARRRFHEFAASPMICSR